MERWLAELTADEARRQRRREHLQTLVQQESATLLGHLVDLADTSQSVVLDTMARPITGRLAGVALDVVFLEDQGRRTIVALAALTAVRTERDHTPTGDRPAALDATMAEVLYELAAERERVTATTTASQRVTGTLVSVGSDVVTIRVDAGDVRTTVLRLDALNDVVIS